MFPSAKYRIVLFQPYLRKHITNFGINLKKFEFIIKKPTNGNFYHTQLPTSHEGETQRVKTNKINTMRRLLGVANVRIKFDKEADLFFTYGSLLITNKPYCVYIENGVALYNYDVEMAKHPIAQLLVSFLLRRNICKGIIFMSKAAEKSFFSTVQYSKKTQDTIQKKAVQIYPLVDAKNIQPKQATTTLRLLFTGMFYMKGGLEIIHAYAALRKKYQHIELTIVTPLQTVRSEDIAFMQNMPEITLLDAKLGPAEMENLYTTHDVFLLPTYRDSFGLVLIEAISYGMPIICTNQFATTEVAIHKYNAFVYPDNPLKDYDADTLKLLGKYRNPKDFYADLFQLQKQGALKPIELFIFESIEKFISDPKLLAKFSKNSMTLYNSTFHQDIISEKIETVFRQAVE